MAYIIGALTSKEKATLRKRGWDVEPITPVTLAELNKKCLSLVFVDSSMFNVMSGPNWDKGNLDESTAQNRPGRYRALRLETRVSRRLPRNLRRKTK
jgi:hypothetical protein